MIALAGFVGYQFLIMFALRATLEKQLHALLAPSAGGEGGSSLLAARVLAWSVVVVLTVIMALMLVDYYGHNRSALSNPPPPEMAAPRDSAAAAPHDGQAGASVAEPGQDGDALGTFGDFFGGVLNPLLTFGTLVALAITMLMQRTQLALAEESTKKTLHQMHKQGFETTFFNLLTLHNNSVQELQFDPEKVKIPVWQDDPGRLTWDVDAEEKFDAEGKPEYFDYRATPNRTFTSTLVGSVRGRAVFGSVLGLMKLDHNIGATELGIYSRIQLRHNYVLGHYFRTLFQLLELVDEYAKDTDEKTARRYSRIIRAQLSENELILLFYNCAYSLVDQGKFRDLLVRYAMLEHMPLQVMDMFCCLRTPNYTFELGRHVRQYFGYSDTGVLANAGAFGTNPEANEYVGILKQRTIAATKMQSRDATGHKWTEPKQKERAYAAVNERYEVGRTKARDA